MDNALENFYRILSSIQEDVDDLEVVLAPEKLLFSFSNFNEFSEALILEIQHKYKNMIVIEQDKKTGTNKEVKKDFILLQEGKIIQIPVQHFPRMAGTAKFGLWNRLLGPLIDCFAYVWMKKKYINYEIKNKG